MPEKKPPSLILAEKKIQDARRILVDGLKYYEYDGRDMPKTVARDALEALGLPRDEQP